MIGERVPNRLAGHEVGFPYLRGTDRTSLAAGQVSGPHLIPMIQKSLRGATRHRRRWVCSIEITPRYKSRPPRTGDGCASRGSQATASQESWLQQPAPDGASGASSSVWIARRRWRSGANARAATSRRRRAARDRDHRDGGQQRCRRGGQDDQRRGHRRPCKDSEGAEDDRSGGAGSPRAATVGFRAVPARHVWAAPPGHPRASRAR